MPVLFDSKTIAARDNFSLWQEFVASAFLGMKAEPTSMDPFVARVELSNASGTDIATARFPGQRLYRSKAEIAHIVHDAYCVALVESGLSQGTHGDVSFTARPGDLVIIDVSKPFDLSISGEGTKLSVIQIDKRQFAQRLAEPKLVPVTASTTGGAAALLASYIGGLAQCAATLPAASAGRAASIACDLFTLAFSQRATADLGAESVHDARLVAALTFIARNITDVGLDAKRVACHLGISPRSVYDLFARSGLSLAETILSRRLKPAVPRSSTPHMPGGRLRAWHSISGSATFPGSIVITRPATARRPAKPEPACLEVSMGPILTSADPGGWNQGGARTRTAVLSANRAVMAFGKLV